MRSECKDGATPDSRGRKVGDVAWRQRTSPRVIDLGPDSTHPALGRHPVGTRSANGEVAQRGRPRVAQKNPVEAQGVNGAEGRKMQVEKRPGQRGRRTSFAGHAVGWLSFGGGPKCRVGQPTCPSKRITRQTRPGFLSHPRLLCAASPDCPDHRQGYGSSCDFETCDPSEGGLTDVAGVVG
jgi:hypothetical protein